MRTLVTGGTGFIGRHVVQRLHEGSHRVRCLARDTGKGEEPRRMGVEVVVGDVTHPRSLLDGMRDCEWVASLATPTSSPGC